MLRIVLFLVFIALAAAGAAWIAEQPGDVVLSWSSWRAQTTLPWFVLIAGVALVADATQRSVRVALGSVGPTILRAPECERFVVEHCDFGSQSLSEANLKEAAALAASAASPITDHRSTAEYRRHAVGVLAGRLLRRAFPNG